MATKTVTKTKAAKAAPKPKAAPRAKASGVVVLDPNLPLIPGNSVSFVAEAPEGEGTFKIETPRGVWKGRASVSGGFARAAKILESDHGEITVTFYDDDKEYASGTWPIG